MCYCIDEAVVLLIPPDLADQKARVENDAGSNRAKEDESQENPNVGAPVQDDPAAAHRNRNARQAHSER